MIDPQALLTDLKRQVRDLEVDLREQAVGNIDLEREWREAREASRTAASYDSWLGERVTQVAVAWVLSTVFVRFCEDNDLIELPVIGGPGDRTAVARERQQEFFYRHPALADRDWITEGFNALSVSPVVAGLFESHNPMWTILPSPQAAKALLEFWRTTDASGAIVHEFTDPEWNTRFLGDLYQNLSDDAREKFALLQTPEFVEEFILKKTLDPAIEEFGLEPDPPFDRPDLPRRLRVIDPTCGSGHFLLGAFHRILKSWEAQSGACDRWTLIRLTLESVHGADKNPFAVAIARFRLMLAAMKAADLRRFSSHVDFPLYISVGDSLIHGRGAVGTQGEFDFSGDSQVHTYATEDVGDYVKSVDILGSGSYHVVVGNPPYISVDDKKEDAIYRSSYLSCYKEYSLSVPFAERFFRLAIPGNSSGFSAGYVSQITANSFMKREFGKRLTKEFFCRVDLTHVIDTSGAYIPGHGTPTVILLGRRRHPKSPVVRTVRSVSGEPGIPPDAAKGIVWSEIATRIDHPGFNSRWISVDDLDRKRYFDRHPWILESGGLELVEEIQSAAAQNLSSATSRVGYFGDSHADQAFILPITRRTKEISSEIFATILHRGQQIRDWQEESVDFAILPYDQEKKVISEDRLPARFVRMLWPLRTELRNRVDFSGKRYFAAGRGWWEWHQLPKDLRGHNWVIAYSDLSTCNHFILNTSGDAYNRHAPIIRLKLDASPEDYYGLLGLLNSSTACFFLQQLSYNRGEGGGARVEAGYAAMGSEGWKNNYDYVGSVIEQIPVTSQVPLESGRSINDLSNRMAAAEPNSLLEFGIVSQASLDTARKQYSDLRGKMIALQEELDWDVYRRYRLLDEDQALALIADPDDVPELKLGERAFEIGLARRMAAGEVVTQWFERHQSTPVTEIPAHWPQAYKDVVARRIEVIERDRNIGLIERPECKRRWQSESWEKKESAALTNWLLDRCEDKSLWRDVSDQPSPMTVNRLADRLRTDADAVSVARLLKGPDADLADVLAGIIADDHVPYLAQLRYKGEGLLKRAQWERTWDLQREEDATGERLDIPVPPKYKPADFVKASYWSHRGKLDVPKERFISYPHANPDGDGSLLIGWAGWNHREQARALITLIEERTNTDGWEIDRIKPLLVGLAEVMPWVRQWHNKPENGFAESPADAYDGYLVSQQEKYGLSTSDLRAWNPPAVSRGRRRGPGRTG